MIFSALAVARLQDAELARELIGPLEPYAGRCVLLGAGGALWGTVERYLGFLPPRRGRPRGRRGPPPHRAGARPGDGRAPGRGALRGRAGLGADGLGDPAGAEHAARAEAAARELGLERLLDQIDDHTPPARATTPSSP